MNAYEIEFESKGELVKWREHAHSIQDALMQAVVNYAGANQGRLIDRIRHVGPLPEDVLKSLRLEDFGLWNPAMVPTKESV